MILSVQSRICVSWEHGFQRSVSNVCVSLSMCSICLAAHIFYILYSSFIILPSVVFSSLDVIENVWLLLLRQSSITAVNMRKTYLEYCRQELKSFLLMFYNKLPYVCEKVSIIRIGYRRAVYIINVKNTK